MYSGVCVQGVNVQGVSDRGVCFLGVNVQRVSDLGVCVLGVSVWMGTCPGGGGGVLSPLSPDRTL